ncbi:MAG TPA: FlgD immunoglobulin-like domain containing protein, partial [bacterium]|nr:FlgD immunoglobulin-like domain containing protein [bacterium]
LKDADENGFLDGTNILLSRISLEKYDGDKWKRLDQVWEGNSLKAYTLSFSTFTLIAKTSQTQPLLEGIRLFPNPFRERVYIWYQLSSPAPVTIKIFNLTGDRVKEIYLSQGETPPAQWQGDNYRGEKVADGAYIMLIESAGEKLKKIVGVLK